jgi:hypothetical protein
MKKFLGSVLGGTGANPLVGKTIQIQKHFVRVQKQIGEGGFSCIFEASAGYELAHA